MPKAPPDRLAYSIPDAAIVTGLSEPFVHKLVGRGELPSIKIGRSRRILHEDLVEFLRERRSDRLDEAGR